MFYQIGIVIIDPSTRSNRRIGPPRRPTSFLSNFISRKKMQKPVKNQGIVRIMFLVQTLTVIINVLVQSPLKFRR